MAKDQSSGQKTKASSKRDDAKVSKRSAQSQGTSVEASSSRVTVPSTLSADSIDFPRGGGHKGITSVEYKQLVNEGRAAAAKDTGLFDEGGPKSKSKRRNVDEQQADAGTNKKKTKRFRSFKEKDKQDKHDAIIAQAALEEKAKSKKDNIRIEGLNYKRLLLKTKILVQIVEVNDLELIVSLPNQMLGHIPMTNITPKLTEILQQQMDDSDSEDEMEVESTSLTMPTMTSMFNVGQWLQAAVSALTDSTKRAQSDRDSSDVARASRKVELTLDSAVVNENISSSDVQKGSVLSACVMSVEDHGYALSLGMKDLSAFLPFSEMPSTEEPHKLSVGQAISVAVQTLTAGRRTCSVTLKPQQVQEAEIAAIPTISGIAPGQLMTGLITLVTASGLHLQILGYFDAFVEWRHACKADQYQLLSQYTAGEKLTCRVLWTLASADKTFVALSALPHVVKFEHDNVAKQALVKGSIHDSVEVVHVEAERGVTCKISPNYTGFMHISQASESHIASLAEDSGRFKKGSHHRARIIGYAAVDDVYQLSCKPSVLEKAFLRVEDAPIGERISGTVKHISASKLFVDVGGNVDAVVWPTHFADVQIKQIEKKYKVGQKVSGRLLYKDPQNNRVALTLKKSLVKTEETLIRDWSDVTRGIITVGTIISMRDAGIVLEFFGNLKAFVPLGECRANFTRSPSEIFRIGQTVKARIIAIDHESHRLVASLRQVDEDSSVGSELPLPKVGSTLEASIQSYRPPNAILGVAGATWKVLCACTSLAASRSILPKDLEAELPIKSLVGNLSVVSCNEAKNFVIATVKSVSSKENPSALKALEVGQLIQCRIQKLTTSAIKVLANDTLPGQIHLSDISDNYDNVVMSDTIAGESSEVIPEVGSLVDCTVVRLNRNKQLLDLSLRPSRLRPQEQHLIKDREIDSITDLEIGQRCRGFVKNISSSGLFVEIGRTVTARILIKNLFDDYVKDWQSRFEISQVVEGKVSAINTEDQRVELSLRRRTVSKEKSLQLHDFSVGQKVNAVVKKTEAFGLFLRIEETSVSGLCHKTEISDDPTANLTDAINNFAPGDPVKAIILSIDTVKNRIAFGMKPSYFDETDFEAELENVDSEDEAQQLNTAADHQADDTSDSDQDENISSEADDVNKPSTIDDQVAATSREQKKDSIKLSAPGFQWSVEGIESDDEAPVEANPKIKQAKTKKSSDKVATDLTKEKAERQPETSQDFERLLAMSPSSALLWIQYMSFQLSLGEISKAREIARRGLRLINYREGEERLNLWIALLNLENAYGDEESFDSVFKEASQVNDTKMIYRLSASLLEKDGKIERAQELYKKASKKFNTSCKSWTLWAEFYMRQNRLEEARALLPRSLQSLPKRKHVKVISRFGLLEFSSGESERGKTIFEGIFSSYPKRFDLWLVYIDQLVKDSDIQSARGTIERLLGQDDLKMHKAKSIFKKWLAIEKRLGTAEEQEHVKRRAQLWISNAHAAAPPSAKDGAKNRGPDAEAGSESSEEDVDESAVRESDFSDGEDEEEEDSDDDDAESGMEVDA